MARGRRRGRHVEPVIVTATECVSNISVTKGPENHEFLKRIFMASSDQNPSPMPGGDGSVPPGKDLTVGQKVLDKGAQMMQSLKPVKKMSQHVCTFAIYSHDMTRQVETHHYVSRLNQDFLQCAVYDSDELSARLIGVEYIISGRIFDTLPPDEQKFWHSHGYEIKSGLWMSPRVPQIIEKQELQDLAQSYGKFWCTWQIDRGDRLPLGAPSLMVSPQGASGVKSELIEKRDQKYMTSTEELRKAREGMVTPEKTNPWADHWVKTGKGFAIDVEQTEMRTRGDTFFP